MSTSTTRKFDIVVWGSTGFTGKLVCEYLSNTYPDLRWAIAGRNAAKLQELKSKLNLKDGVEVLTADISDESSLNRVASATKVVLATAGPFAKIGSPVVKACVEGGAHYCDITGEAPWIRAIADQYFDAAKAKNLKIVNCCGFDCIPCDLGAQMIADEAMKRKLLLKEIRFLAGETKGGASGGTLASVFNLFETLPMKELMKLGNPFYLNPLDPTTKKITVPHDDVSLTAASSDNAVMGYDSVEKSWTMPYVMQAIDTRLVNRSFALNGWKYGRNLVYSERMIAPNMVISVLATIVLTVFQLLLFTKPTRALLKMVMPKPGEGPSQHLLDHGYFKARLWGKALDRDTGNISLVRGSVVAMNGDPGYRQTAKMVSEAAVCLALDSAKLPTDAGVLTPSVAMGPILRERLCARGMHFTLDA